MNRIYTFSLLILTLISGTAPAQTAEPDVLNNSWQALWITVPTATSDGYGVYVFRKSVDLPSKPAKFVIHVSADNRYKLYVNEKFVSLGPARGDLSHWNYETVDISPYLKVGKNIIAAQVWNEGTYRPEAQISYRTGFILQGATSKESVLNTITTWLCEQDRSFAPLPFQVKAYYVSGPGEIRTMANGLKNWQSESFNDSNWQQAKRFLPEHPKINSDPTVR